MRVPFYQRDGVTLYEGDALEVLRLLPEGLAQTCVTSPPYWNLRDYGVEGQLGLEATPEEYVARMVEVFREVRRVLRVDGTLWLNLGDCYCTTPRGNREGDLSTSSLTNPQRQERLWGKHAYRDQYREPRLARNSGLKHKDLVGIPWRVAFALQADGWWLRMDNVWAKPNPMPESVTDRPTRAHEYIFLLSKSAEYFYDSEAIKEPRTGPAEDSTPEDLARAFSRKRAAVPEPRQGPLKQDGAGGRRYQGFNARWDATEAGGAPTTRNKRSVWTVASAPFKDAHFATFPPKLIEPCILAGTSERGCCSKCGAPWEREVVTDYRKSPVHGAGSVVGRHYETGQNNFDGAGLPRLDKVTRTTGWRPGCDCGAPAQPCVVLDPFNGAGTTGLVSAQHGRHYVGVELKPDYLAMSARRIGEATAQQSLFRAAK